MREFHPLNQLDGSNKPSHIDYPFANYNPHPWAILAANVLKKHLSEYRDVYFLEVQDGLPTPGKMFGVLVCENSMSEIGFLAAFSGQLTNGNNYHYFAPPVFDVQKPNIFYMKMVEELALLNNKIAFLQNDERRVHEINKIESSIKELEAHLVNKKLELRLHKQQRDVIRMSLDNENVDFINKITELNQQSANENMDFKRYKKKIDQQIYEYRNNQTELDLLINELKQNRKQLSKVYQNLIFEEFSFLNSKEESKNLYQLFEVENGVLPPSGAGECAAPKLFQFAYLSHLKPLAMAEFWWGTSSKSEVRKHNQYYPSCNGKCKPILSHMLSGLPLEEDPMLSHLHKRSEEIKELEIIYEDDYMVVVNKPEEFLSVPGKEYSDSILWRLKEKYPDATGPLLLHRLDMSTSGILLAAKNKEVHFQLQKQFIERKITKRYTAILDGILAEEKGVIELPLRVDLEDRPRQIVDFEHGKKALTRFERIKIENEKTWVYFLPHTGRTHQLRVHAAHPLGLNLPILGDDLYGKKSNRLYLHADYIKFFHPILQKEMQFEAIPDF